MSDKSLMTEINKHTRNIDKNVSRFGTKLPGNDNKEQEQTLQELSYEQMIMGTLASLTFGIKNIKKDTQVKQLLSRQNIFDLVKTISYNSTATKNILANIVKNNKSYYDKIIPIITKIGNGTNDESTQNEIKNKIQIEGNGFKDLTELLKELQNDKLNKNVFINIDSLITVLSKLGNADFDKLEEAAKKNLIKLRNLIINNSGSLGDIIEQISEMVKDKDISANIMSLSDIIDTIIHILEIDPTKINLMGLQTLVQITDPKTGLIAQLLAQLQDATNEIKLNKDNFISLETFFNSLASLTDIGFIKRRRIKNNIQFINKYIIDEIPNILDKIREVADDNQESAYTAINNLTALFSAITEISGMKLNDRVRLLMNLKFVKDIYLKEIIDILDQFKNVINGDFTSVVQALDSITRVFDMILKIGDISMIKIMKISFKTDVISDILQDSIESLLDIILEMKQVDEALNKIMDIEKVFNAIKIIYSNIPGLGSSFKASLALSMLMSNATQINELIDVLNNLEKFKRQQTIEQTLPRLINNLMKLFEFEGDSKRKLEDTNYLIIYFKDNIVKNLSKTIENLNNIPALKNSNVWLKSLKTILKEFDSGGTDAGEDSVGSLLYNIPSEDILKNFLKFGTSLKLVVTTITSINKIDEEQQKNIESMLSITKTVVSAFNADDEESIGGLLYHIKEDNIEKVDSLIKMLEKIAKLNKVKFVLNISEKSIKTFAKIAEPLKDFFEKLSHIEKSDIKKANEAFNAFMKIVIGGAAILIIGSLAIALVKPANLILFTLTLGAFLLAVGLVFRLVHSGFKETMKGAKDAMIIVGIGAAVMIIGSWFASSKLFPAAMLFAIELGIFITAIGLVFWLVNKGFKETMAGAKNAMIIVGSAALIMIFGALTNKYINFIDVMLFTVKLGVFLLALGGIFWIINKLFDGTYKSIKKALLVVALSALVMIGAQLIYKYLDVKSVFGFLLILGGFLTGLAFIYKIAGSLMKKALASILLCTIVTTLSAAMLLFIGLITKEHPEMLLYAILFAVGFGVFVVIMGGICALLSTFSGLIYAGALAMAAVTLVTLLAVGVLYIMYEVCKEPKFILTILEGLLSMVIVFGVFGVLITVLGALVFGPQAAIFAAGVVALAVLCGIAYLSAKVLQAIAYAVKALKETNVTEDDLKQISNTIDGFVSVIDTLLSKMPSDPLKLLKLLAVATVINKTATALSSIAKGIQAFAKLKFPSKFDSKGNPIEYATLSSTSFETAQRNIGRVITTISNALLDVAKTNPKLFNERLFTDSPAMHAVKVATKMGDALHEIAKGVIDWVNIKIPVEYDSEGNPTKWENISQGDFKKVGEHIGSVLTCIGNAIITTAKNNEDIFGTGWKEGILNTDTPAMNAVKCIQMMGQVVNDTAAVVAGYAAGKMPIWDKDGKLAPKSQWVDFDPNEISVGGKAYNAIYGILTGLGQAIIDATKKSKVFKSGWWEDLTGADAEGVNAAKSISQIGKSITGIVNAIKVLDKFDGKVPDFSSLKRFLTDTSVGIKEINDALKNLNIEKVSENIEDAKKAMAAINELIPSINEYVKQIKEKSLDTQDLANLDIAGNLNAILTVIKTLKNVDLSALDNLGNFNATQFKTQKEKIDAIIDIYLNVFNKISSIAQNASNLNSTNYNVLRDGILTIFQAIGTINSNEGFSKQVDDLEKFVKTVNSIKLDKISEFKTFVSAVKDLSAQLSGADGLADTLSNKLTVVLFELVEQLRKAEASIENAHILQERRKKAIEESISKMQNILNQHMIVEIYQGTNQNGSGSSSSSRSSGGSINGVQPQTTAYTGDEGGTSDMAAGINLENPDNAKAKLHKSSSEAATEESLTFQQFKEYMENDFMNNFRG